MDRLSLIKFPGGGGDGKVTGADQGLSLNGTIVELGQVIGLGTTPSLISSNREIPFSYTSNGATLAFRDTGSNLLTTFAPGIITTTNNVSSAQIIHGDTSFVNPPFNSVLGFYLRSETLNVGSYITINNNNVEAKALSLLQYNIGLGYGHIISATTYDGVSPFGGYPTIIGSLSQGNGVAVGYKATAANPEATALGPQSYADAMATIAIGDAAKATGHVWPGNIGIGGTIPPGIYGNQICIGDATFTNGNINLFIGGGAGINNNFAIVLGGAGSSTTYNVSATTDDHQGFLGWYQHDSPYFTTGVGYVNDWWLGGPIQASIPHAISLNITSGLGTNQPGIPFKIVGSRGTGTGISGDITLQTAEGGLSGSTLQNTVDRLVIKGATGNIGINTSTPSEKLDVNGFGSFSSGIKLPDSIPGTINRNVRLIANSQADNLSILNVFPDTGTNVGTGLYLSPKGTGYSSTVKAQMVITNTDFIVDPVNVDYWVFRGAGSNFEIVSGSSGSATTKSILLSAGKDNGINSNQLWVHSNGNVGIDNATPTAKLHLGSSNGTTNTAPIKLTSGTILTVIEDGALEYSNSHLWFTIGSTRLQIDQQTGALIKYQHTIFTPATGGTVNLVNGQYNIINPTGTIATLTVNLPSSPANNDAVYIKYTQTITTVTYANGTVVDGITAPTAGGLVVLTYDSGTNSWY